MKKSIFAVVSGLLALPARMEQFTELLLVAHCHGKQTAALRKLCINIPNTVHPTPSTSGKEAFGGGFRN